MSARTLTAREKVLAGLVGGVVLLLLNVVLLRFFFGTYQELKQGEAQKAQQLKAMETLLAHTDLWAQRDAWLRDKQPKLENEATAGVQFLNQVQEIAKRHTVLIEQPALVNPERRPECVAVSVNVETKSTWDSLVKFLASLQAPDQFIVLETANLRIDPQDPTQMRGRFRIAKWYAPRG